jgi:hypothetical protein
MRLERLGGTSASWQRIYYFFLKPEGHFGAVPVTFFVAFPFTQVIVIRLAVAGFAAGAALAFGSSGFAEIFTARISL